MRAIYRKIRHARYLYIKRNVEKVWGARYTLGARYLSKNMVFLQGSSFRQCLCVNITTRTVKYHSCHGPYVFCVKETSNLFKL